MKSSLVLFVAVLALFCAKIATGFGSQSYTVKGKLMCGNKAADGVRVKLVDEDDGPDPDDTMDSGRTDRSGNFRLTGSESELGSIEPRLKIYHDCNDGITPCQRKWKIKLPGKYINKRDELDIGTWNLEVKLKGEERDCIHFFS